MSPLDRRDDGTNEREQAGADKRRANTRPVLLIVLIFYAILACMVVGGIVLIFAVAR